MYLLDIWKARNGIAFRKEVLSIQRLKSYFVFLLRLETKMFVVDGPLMFSHIIDCGGSR